MGAQQLPSLRRLLLAGPGPQLLPRQLPHPQLPVAARRHDEPHARRVLRPHDLEVLDPAGDADGLAPDLSEELRPRQRRGLALGRLHLLQVLDLGREEQHPAVLGRHRKDRVLRAVPEADVTKFVDLCPRVRHDPAPDLAVHAEHQHVAVEAHGELIARLAAGAPHDPPALAGRVPPLADLLQHGAPEVEDAGLLARDEVPQAHAALALADADHDLHAGVDGEVVDAARGAAHGCGVAAGAARDGRDGGLDGGQQAPVADAGDGDGGVLGAGQQLGAGGEGQPGDGAGVVHEGAQLPVLAVLEDGPAGDGREELLVRGGLCGRGVGGQVVDVDALVSAAGGEHDLLRLARHGGARRGEGEASDGRGVGVEEERVGEVYLGGGLDGGCGAVEDAVVGPRYYLYRYGRLGAFWCCLVGTGFGWLGGLGFLWQF